jgi:hypothetical protein
MSADSRYRIAVGTTWDLTDRFVVGVGRWIVLHRRRHLPLAVGFEILEVPLGVKRRREAPIQASAIKRRQRSD